MNKFDMTANEALDIFRGLLARVVPTEENTATTNEAWEAVAVLRAVVEDYEKARPLLEAAANYITAYDDPSDVLKSARAYRVGRKA